MHQLLDSGAGQPPNSEHSDHPLILRFISMIGYEFPSVRKAAV
jgi:hypothetical protein